MSKQFIAKQSKDDLKHGLDLDEKICIMLL